MTRLFLEMNAYDIKLRIADEGKSPLAPLIHVHELRQPGTVMQDENVKVTSVLVDHPASGCRPLRFALTRVTGP